MQALIFTIQGPKKPLQGEEQVRKDPCCRLLRLNPQFLPVGHTEPGPLWRKWQYVFCLYPTLSNFVSKAYIGLYEIASMLSSGPRSCQCSFRFNHIMALDVFWPLTGFTDVQTWFSTSLAGKLPSWESTPLRQPSDDHSIRDLLQCVQKIF